jgi:hypothetical protein
MGPNNILSLATTGSTIVRLFHLRTCRLLMIIVY